MSVVKRRRPDAMPSARISSRPGSKNGRLTAGEQLDLARIDVDADDLVADRRHRRRVHGSEVAAADDRKTHGVSLPGDRDDPD